MQIDLVRGADPPLRAPPSEEEMDAIVAFIHAHGRRRKANFGAAFNEPDFLVGVMSVFFALGWNDRIRAGWVFGPLAGKSVFGEENPS